MTLPDAHRGVVAALDPDQRLARRAAVALFVTMFLPWYSRSATASSRASRQGSSDTLTAFGVFSFVEAAVLLVAVGVLVPAVRTAASERAFHLPGGDGTVDRWPPASGSACSSSAASFDNNDGNVAGFTSVDYGVTWGIFVTFLVRRAAGLRRRAPARVVAEPPLPPPASPADRPTASAHPRRARATARRSTAASSCPSTSRR